MPAPPVPFLHRAREALDRALHPRRHRIARAVLGALPPEPKILFVCRGNLCRSPYAAEALRAAVPRAVRGTRSDSAGLVGPGRSAPATARLAASLRGANIHAHVSRLMTPQEALTADLILVMDGAQRREIRRRFGRTARVLLLGDLDPLAGPREIRDPLGHPLAVFHACYARIDRAVLVLASALRAAAPRHDPVGR